ncbi:MAG: zf-HC2 domain-containing protein [Deltaproteobacteria bacterium]|nr:zf-HC2 domain-containing protein [Deltaproteobacteria bacterium]
MSCRDVAPLLSERASGVLAPADEARLAAHLAGCGACRAEADRLQDLASLLRVPEADPAEERGAAFLPARCAAAARAPAPGRLRWATAGAAAALAVSLGVAAGVRATRHPPQGEVVAAAEVAPAAWQEPDPDELWELSGPLALDSDDAP